MGDKDRINLALADIAEGLSKQKAARKHDVPRRKLQSQCQCARPHKSCIKTILTPEEEEALVKVIVWGYRSGQGWSPRRV